jgi:hypothetical protein
LAVSVSVAMLVPPVEGPGRRGFGGRPGAAGSS